MRFTPATSSSEGPGGKNGRAGSFEPTRAGQTVSVDAQALTGRISSISSLFTQ